MENLKHKIRKLKKAEKIIRFKGGEPDKGKTLVWDSFFDTKDAPDGNAKYKLHDLAALSRREYIQITDEFFARVYYEFYKENGLIFKQTHDPALLTRMGLPFDADSTQVKKKFRELVKEHHPDAGGDASRFIELMQVYEQLVK
jgi:putative intracellular protease/amidase